MKLNDCARLLLAKDRFLLLTHRNPDGDTMGSAAALCAALRRKGKTAYLFPNRQATGKLLDYTGAFFAPADYAPDYTVAVDIATEKLFPEGFEGAAELCIDHHPTNEHYAKQELIWADRAACGEIVLELVKSLCGRPSREEAELLYIAISTDCGCFQYANTDARTLRAAAELLDCGADSAAINQRFFRRVSRARLKLEGMIYDSLRFYKNGELVIALLTDEMLRAAGAVEDDLDHIASLAGRAEGHRVSITIRDCPGGASRVSVRSGADFDSSALCAIFGGGGHFMAAGCTIQAPPEKARELLLQVIDEVWT